MSAPEPFTVRIRRNTLRWLEGNPHDFDSLASGPLGAALTRDELRDLADNEESMRRFIESVRGSVASRWHGCDAEATSLAWEAHTGADSIATIERIYWQTPGGAYACMHPACTFVRRDAEALWRHVHTAHGPNCLPPDDFDPGPWL